MRRLMILVVAVFLLTPSTVLAGIKYLPPSVWTPQEKWVWEQVSQGEIADFNKAEGYGGKLSPRKSEGWKENRILRPKFLETILLQEPYQNALTHRGVRIVGAWFKEPVDLSNATIPSQLWLNGSRFEQDVDLICLKSPSFLSLEGSVFVRSLDLARAKIEMINMSSATFNGTLIMGGLEVGNLQDVPESWPDTLKLQLDGFVYHNLGGLSGNDRTDMATREISWLKEWLGKQRSYSPRPYQQLAKVLKNAGYEDKATEILFEGKKRQQKETKTLSPNWWVLFLQWSFIGYGYHNFRVLYWVLILCGLGMLTLHRSGQDVAHRMKYWGLCYSLDMLLPIIELHKPNYDIVLEGWVRVYFYVHKIFGYLLASFLIAGLSGLTKM